MSKPIPPPPTRKASKRNARKDPFPYLARLSATQTPVSERHAQRYNDDPKRVRRVAVRTENIVQANTLDPAFAPAGSDRAAQRMAERDARRSEYVGRTSKLPECGAPALRSDSNAGSKFRNV